MKEMQKWVGPEIIIGSVAQGKMYYRRENIENEIISEINKGNHILLSAPRRVGKTSIVRFLEQEKLKNANCIFRNIQDLKSEKEFYKTIYELIYESLKNNQKVFASLKNFFSGRGLKSIDVKGSIEFADKKEFDYKAEIEVLIGKLEENNTKVILFIDELPDVLHHLHTNNKKEEAVGILKSIRAWRQNFDKNILLFVWTGSIGLRHVVSSISKSTNDLNDLKEINFKPYTEEEALDYISKATKNATIKYTDKLSHYLLDKIKYKIPYFINIMLDEINKIAKQTNNIKVDTKLIDTAFNNQINENDYFVDWFTRLFKYFEKSDAIFMNEVLIFIAHKDKINDRELYDLAVKHDKKLTYMLLIKTLLNDGYIVKNESKYFFVSPFLSGFWLKNNPIYDN